MQTYTRIVYQIIFHTRNWENSLKKNNRERLFEYISKTLMNKRCFVYKVGGYENHIHILISLHPTIALSSLVKDIKLSTTYIIQQKKLFPHFIGWGEGYGAFTYTPDALPNLIKYIENQESHHKNENPYEETKRLIQEFDIEFQEKYLR
jgi:REP element-mobilizing transposase RayT